MHKKYVYTAIYLRYLVYVVILHPNTVIIFRPQPATIVIHIRIPQDKLLQRQSIRGRNVEAVFVRIGAEVEYLTVGNHVLL